MEKIITQQNEHIVKVYTEHTEQITIEMMDRSALDLFVMSQNSTEKQTITISAGRDCQLRITTLDLGGEEFKRNTTIELTGQGSHCELNGVFITSGTENCANRIKISHLAENCHSEQTFRGVASGTSHASFEGHIYVARDAQQTVALQKNHNILLSDGARIETRPELEIYADNVKCNHGATVGKQDSTAMFYLRQRGIEPHAARALMIEGFCRSAMTLNVFPDEIQSMASECLTTKLLNL